MPWLDRGSGAGWLPLLLCVRRLGVYPPASGEVDSARQSDRNKCDPTVDLQRLTRRFQSRVTTPILMIAWFWAPRFLASAYPSSNAKDTSPDYEQEPAPARSGFRPISYRTRAYGTSRDVSRSQVFAPLVLPYAWRLTGARSARAHHPVTARCSASAVCQPASARSGGWAAIEGLLIGDSVEKLIF